MLRTCRASLVANHRPGHGDEECANNGDRGVDNLKLFVIGLVHAGPAGKTIDDTTHKGELLGIRTQFPFDGSIIGEAVEIDYPPTVKASDTTGCGPLHNGRCVRVAIRFALTNRTHEPHPPGFT